MVTSEDVTARLDALGIPHGTMRPLAVRNNLSFTDDELVFCKLTRQGFSPHFLSLELALAAHYGPRFMLTPLHPELVDVTGTSMSVWQYMDMYTLEPETLTPEQAAIAAKELTLLHALTPSRDVELEPWSGFEFVLERVRRRITHAIELGMKKNEADPLLELHRTHLAISPPLSSVLCHGDPHAGNLVRMGEAYRWIDYESARLAPPEFDIACMYLNLMVVGQNAPAWDAAREAFGSIDEERLQAFILARLVSMTSYVLLHPNQWDVFYERVRLLREYQSTGILPSRFPRAD